LPLYKVLKATSLSNSV